jgi:hypothetical protein
MTKRRVGFWALAGLQLVACGSDPEPNQAAANGTFLPLTAASTELIAIARIDANQADQAAQSAAPLENGLPGNLLGGIGSGLTYVGANAYLTIPDRGPNATPYAAAVDNTTSYIPRFHTVKLKLKKSAQGAALPFDVVTKVRKTTLLSERTALVYGSGAGLRVGNGAPALNDKRTFYFSGRSDNFEPNLPSTNATNGRLDPENIRISNDGKHVFIADEYGPYVYQFERRSGRRERVFTLPSEFAVTHLSPVGDTEISGNTSGRVANKGMEGLAITPDGKTLIGAMQSPLIQDGGTNARYLRLVSITLDTGAIEQFAYPLTNIGTASKPKYPTVSEITAINDHEFLVDERDGKGLGDDSAAVFKQIFQIDLSQARDVSGISGEANLAPYAVGKTLFLDLVAQFNAHGIASIDIPAKLEGITFGADVKIGNATKHTLIVSNDNDFLATITDTGHPNGIANPNQFFVFAVDPASLPAFAPQSNAVDSEDVADDATD